MRRLAPLLLLAVVACHHEPCRTLTAFYTTNQPSAEDVATGLAGPVPRCAATDPRCGPHSTRNHRCYRPSDKRELLPPGAKSVPRDDPANAPNACSHDGECQLNGCGNVCTSYRIPPMATVCLGYPWLDERALCGCVDGYCAFFRTGR